MLDFFRVCPLGEGYGIQDAMALLASAAKWTQEDDRK